VTKIKKTGAVSIDISYKINIQIRYCVRDVKYLWKEKTPSSLISHIT